MSGRSGCRTLLVALLIAWFAPAMINARDLEDQEAARLHAEAQRLLDSAGYSEGIEAATRALRLREQSLGSEHPEVANSLQILGKLYFRAGKYILSQSTHLRALALREKLLGPEHVDTAWSLVQLADAYSETYEYARAEPLYLRALTIFEKVAGTNHRGTAGTLLSLAHLYTQTAAYERAEPLFERALAIAEVISGADGAYTGMALNSFAIMYGAMGSSARAASLFRRALAIQEKTLGEENTSTVTTLSNLAIATFYTGSYAEAESMQKRALAIQERVLGIEHPRTARTMTSLANLYVETGSYPQAETLLRRAVAALRKAQGSVQGDLAISLNIWGWMYSEMGLQDKAEPLVREAAELAESVFGAKHPYTAAHLGVLGTVYRRMGAFDRAEPFLQRSVALSEEAVGKEHVATADAVYNLADLYSDSGAYREAEPLYRRALEIYEKELGPKHPYVARALRAIATIHWSRGESQRALSLLERAQGIQTENSARFLAAGSESRKQDYVRTTTEFAFANVSFAMAKPQAAATTLALNSVLQHKGQVLDAVSNGMGRLRRSVTAADRALLEQLSDITGQLSALTYGQDGDLSPEQYRKRGVQLAARQEQLQTELASRNQAFRREVTVVTLAKVKRAIPSNAALVEWFRYTPFDPAHRKLADRYGRPRYVAYVLKPAGEPVAVDMGGAQAIEMLARRLRSALADPASSDVKQRSAALSAKIFAPLRVHLRGVEQILFSSDGALNLIPMAALVDESGAYLAERFNVSYLTSGRDLLRIADESTVLSGAVVMADPDYGKRGTAFAATTTSLQPKRSAELDRGGLTFRQLPGTALEAQDLKTLLQLDEASVLRRGEASESNLKRLKSPGILHIASHGFFLSDQQLTAEIKRGSSSATAFAPSENPLLRSGIALAGANERSSGDEDGILTALEATQLDLSRTELVVLSACDTGVGEVQNGEGVYGLRRALALAGAQTQVTSLWKVSDDVTRKLMVDYHRRLLRGEGRSAALRNTQRVMLGSEPTSHPYYWASFIPIGNWNPLPNHSSKQERDRQISRK